ncbi:MAG: integrase [Candidatus Bathyarchaeia archaeon]
MGLPGFEPGSFPHEANTTALREPKTNKISSKEGINWRGFDRWLQNRLRKAYARKVWNDARKYYYVLFDPSKASVLGGLSKCNRRSAMAALANLSKFLGMYRDWKEIVSQAGLHWQKTSHLEVFLSMLNTDMGDVKSWFREAVERLPEKYSVSLKFAAATGLRPEEACKSISLLSELAEANRLSDYLNFQYGMLEHFRFPNLFIRGCKNCYISFVPEGLLKRVLAVKPKVKANGLRSAIEKVGLKVRIKDLRKLFATTLREKGISEEVIDLLQGRVPQSIFLRHYYKPDLLRNVRENVLIAVKPFVDA